MGPATPHGPLSTARLCSSGRGIWSGPGICLRKAGLQSSSGNKDDPSLGARPRADVPGRLPPRLSQGPGSTGSVPAPSSQGSRYPLPLQLLLCLAPSLLSWTDTGLSGMEAEDSLTALGHRAHKQQSWMSAQQSGLSPPGCPQLRPRLGGQEHGTRGKCSYWAAPDPQDLALLHGEGLPGVTPLSWVSAWTPPLWSREPAGVRGPEPAPTRSPGRPAAPQDLGHLQLGCGLFNSGHVVPTPARPQTQFGVKALLISQSGSHLL